MPVSKVFIIEDDKDIWNLIEEGLPNREYEVETAVDAVSAREWMAQNSTDIILLDLNLPNGNGLDLLQELKNSEKHGIPVIIISSLDQEEDIIRGLETGADDYLTKPFSVKILKARMEAVLRRINEPEQALIRYRDFEIDIARHEITFNNQHINFTKSEFKVFTEFCRHPGIVYTRNQIVEIIHGERTPVTSRSVDVLIVGLRQKLGDNGDLIETVRGIGYRASE